MAGGLSHVRRLDGARTTPTGGGGKPLPVWGIRLSSSVRIPLTERVFLGVFSFSARLGGKAGRGGIPELNGMTAPVWKRLGKGARRGLSVDGAWVGMSMVGTRREREGDSSTGFCRW